MVIQDRDGRRRVPCGCQVASGRIDQVDIALAKMAARRRQARKAAALNGDVLDDATGQGRR